MEVPPVSALLRNWLRSAECQVAVLWSERGSETTVDVTIEPFTSSIYPLRCHFYSLFDRYTRIHAINLMCVNATGKAAGENALSAAYRDIILGAQEQEEEFRLKLDFEDFDFHVIEVRPFLACFLPPAPSETYDAIHRGKTRTLRISQSCSSRPLGTLWTTLEQRESPLAGRTVPLRASSRSS